MIWAILAILGVPLWLCAAGIAALVLQNRSLRKRPGNVEVRVLAQGKKRWSRGHGLWISDVFAWRGSPGVWKQDILWVSGASVVSAETAGPKPPKRLGEEPVFAVLRLGEGGDISVAARKQDRAGLLGPFASSQPR